MGALRINLICEHSYFFVSKYIIGIMDEAVEQMYRVLLDQYSQKFVKRGYPPLTDREKDGAINWLAFLMKLVFIPFKLRFLLWHLFLLKPIRTRRKLLKQNLL